MKNINTYKTPTCVEVIIRESTMLCGSVEEILFQKDENDVLDW